MVARQLRRLACSVADIGRGVRRHALGGVRVPGRVHLRHRLYGLAEAPQRVEHRRRRSRRQFRGTCRCRSSGPVTASRSLRVGGGAVPLASAWTLAILLHTAGLAAISLIPLWFGKGWSYGLGAGIGGAFFLWKSIVLHRAPTKQNAM